MSIDWPPPPLPRTSGSVREARVSKLVALELSSARYARTKVVVRNLSPYGLGVRGDVDLMPCEHIVVHLPGGRDIRGIVRWVRKNTFGISLEERVDQGELAVRQSSPGDIVPRDAELGFHRIIPQTTPRRTGFKRTRRDELLHGCGDDLTRKSEWLSER